MLDKEFKVADEYIKATASKLQAEGKDIVALRVFIEKHNAFYSQKMVVDVDGAKQYEDLVSMDFKASTSNIFTYGSVEVKMWFRRTDGD